ncbi:hypothetical protein BSKO_12851 [Bryopsis sp. KO-2023]|nr:hypothetical protein BSKO_12851 [Bryopsis sp. KO-2023]
MKYSLGNLSTLDLQLLLQARGESSQGSRDELLTRVETVLDARTPFTWHLRQLPSRGPPRVTYRSGGSLVYHNDRLYLYGGFDENFHLHSDFLEGVLDGDQVLWSETTAGSLSGGPQLRDHYAFVYDKCIWLYGGVRIGLQRNTSEYIYCFDLENQRWRSLPTKPAGQNNSWNRPDNQTLSGTTVAVFCEASSRLYAFGHQVMYELGNNGWKAAYLDVTQGLWYGLPLPEGGLDIQAACVWHGRVHVLDSGANLFVMTDHLGWERVELRQVDPTVSGLDDYPIKLSGLVGSVWLLVSDGTPGPVNALQLNLADQTLQRANVDPLGTRREVTVEFLSHTVVNSSMVVTGLLGSHLAPCQSQSATFILETVPGQVPEPLSGSVKLLEACSDLRNGSMDGTDRLALIVQGKQFLAHKTILASRSRYFATMFTSGMVESATDTVTLDDINPDVMDIILDFVYGRTMSIPSNLAVALFTASDRLEIPDLTKVVVCELKSEINVENIAAILQIAGRYDNSELWDACISFARGSRGILASILRGSDYLHLMEVSADLAQKFQLDVLIGSMNACDPPRAEVTHRCRLSSPPLTNDYDRKV